MGWLVPVAASVIAADTGAARLLTIMAPELAFFLRVFVVVPKDLPRVDGLSNNALAAALASLEKAGRSGAYEDDGGAVVARQDLLNVVSFAEKSATTQRRPLLPLSRLVTPGAPRILLASFWKARRTLVRCSRMLVPLSSKSTIKWRDRSTL